MATSFGLASATSVTECAHKSAANLPICHRSNDRVTFRFSPKSNLRFSYKVASSGSAKPAFATPIKAEASPVEAKEDKKSDVVSVAATMPSEEALSAFITQVSELVKLVDSKDIMELHLKQLDSEIVIRKKEALPQPPAAPVTYYQQQPQYAAPPAPAPSAAPTAAPASAPAPVPAKALPPAKSAHPPLKSPMAGTFYRSPAPGEPAFVKVGDKVKKGQVLCIIEAMKLMNEIEADRSGTIVEVVAADAKPVSVDTPLFIIEP